MLVDSLILGHFSISVESGKRHLAYFPSRAVLNLGTWTEAAEMPIGATNMTIELSKSSQRLSISEFHLLDNLTKLIQVSMAEVANQQPGKSIRLDLKVGHL